MSKSDENWPSYEIFELKELIERQKSDGAPPRAALEEDNDDVMDDVRALRARETGRSEKKEKIR